MVLLDRVESWNDSEILCITASHRDTANPFRSAGRLSVFCGVEYGAQAMALHGALISGDQGRPGVLAGLRSVTCHVDWLDDIEEDVAVRAELKIGERTRFLYDFSLRCADSLLVQGQAAVVLL